MGDGTNYGGTMKMFVTNSPLRVRWLVFIFGVFLLGGCGGEQKQHRQQPASCELMQRMLRSDP